VARAMNAGWFPDPGGQPGQRYFDGHWCNEHFAPTPPPSAPAPLPVAIAVSSGGGANHALHAVLTFCPWHDAGLETPGWANTPTPVYWQPVYPSPATMYYSPPPPPPREFLNP
jgi:Protein of unknown function (DUF2510)